VPSCTTDSLPRLPLPSFSPTKNLPDIYKLTLQPHFDFVLRMFNSIDVMSLPGVAQLVRSQVHQALQSICLYPVTIDTDILVNGGYPARPRGILHVRLLRGTRLKTSFLNIGALKTDPFVVMYTNKETQVRSTTKKNDTEPVWDEDFYMLLLRQPNEKLVIKIMDDDFGT